MKVTQKKIEIENRLFFSTNSKKKEVLSNQIRCQRKDKSMSLIQMTHQMDKVY